MKVFLLKAKHVMDEWFDEVGIFSSEEKAREAKEKYLEERRKIGIGPDKYEFTISPFVLDHSY